MGKRGKTLTIYELLGSNKEYLKGKTTCIFDMDGTLIDSMMYWRNADGIEFDTYNDFIMWLFDKYNTVVEPKEHAVEFLRLLHDNGIPFCIASDTPRRLAEGFFKRYPCFDELVEFYADSDDVGAYKAHSSDIYKFSAEKLGVKKSECIVFEDNMSSVLSAYNAGFDVVGVFDKQNEKNTETIRAASVEYINDFSELMK